MALNTNPITEFRTELKTLPISADIYTESFIQDLAVTDVESLLEQYSPAGFGGANPTTSGQGLGRAGDYNAQSTTVLRGLATGENLTWRNGVQRLPSALGAQRQLLQGGASKRVLSRRGLAFVRISDTTRLRPRMEKSDGASWSSAQALRISKFDFFGPTR